MEENISPADTQPEATPQVENNETVKNPEAVLAKNRELLGERRVMASELAELKAQMKTINDEKLMAEGNKDEVITSLRGELDTIKKTSKEKEDAFNRNTVFSQIKEAAAKKGCKNPDALLKLMSTDDLNTIEVYDDYKVNTEDLNRVLEKTDKDYSEIKLFGKSVKVDDLTPGSKIVSSKKSLDQMSTAELEAELAKQ